MAKCWARCSRWGDCNVERHSAHVGAPDAARACPAACTADCGSRTFFLDSAAALPHHAAKAGAGEAQLSASGADSHTRIYEGISMSRLMRLLGLGILGVVLVVGVGISGDTKKDKDAGKKS